MVTMLFYLYNGNPWTRKYNLCCVPCIIDGSVKLFAEILTCHCDVLVTAFHDPVRHNGADRFLVVKIQTHAWNENNKQITIIIEM